jgi:NitT/TauT family transport system substrate-binding protein
MTDSRAQSPRPVRKLAGLVAALAVAVAACSGSGATAAPSSAAPSAAPSTAPSVAASQAPSAAASASAAPSSAAPSMAAIPSPEAGTFKMGTEPWLGYGPWWIAKEKDFFGKEGVTTTVTNFDADDQINAALVSGQIDGANIATHTALRLISSGTPITIVLLLDQSNSADAMIAGPGVTSVADLKGKKVAYEEGTTSDILLRYALSQNAMTIADVTKVPTPANNVGNVLIAKKVDAGVTYEPYLTSTTTADPTIKVIYKAEALPGLIGDVFVVRNDYLASHPGQVYAELRAWGDAVAYYNANTTDGQAIIEKAVGADAGSLKTAFDGVTLYDLKGAKDLMTGGAYGKTLTMVKQIATDAGIITSPVDETKVVDTTFISALVP